MIDRLRRIRFLAHCTSVRIQVQRLRTIIAMATKGGFTMRRTILSISIGVLLSGSLTAILIPGAAGAAPRIKKPGAPTALVLTPVNTAIAASWSAPLSDGGSAVINYVAKAGNGIHHPCVSTGPTSCIASGLKNGKSYVVKVQAVNVKGPGRVARLSAVPTTAQNCAYVGPYANLQNCNHPDLFAANLTDANLSGADLSNDSLYYTNFTGANLSGADLTGAGAQNATFTDANLTDAILTDADLTNATLTGATLTGATLTDTTLNNETSSGIVGTPSTLPSGWSLVGGFLVGPGADLYAQDLSGLTFPPGADLEGVHIYYTSFAGDDLTGADFTGASGDNADFANATLTGANFTNADLYNDNFTGTTLTGVTWSNTECPDASNSDTNGSSPDSCVGYGI